MGLAEKIQWISIDEYLAGEEISQIKHEYLDGVGYAMVETSDRHNRIAGNIFNALHIHLADNPCEPFMESMKVRVDPKTCYYLDVLVACEGAEANPYYRNEPRVIVEVTSPSTERIDRIEKLSAYKQISSLQEYLIVSQETVRIDLYRRLPDQSWQCELFTQPSEELHLESVNLTLSVAHIYRRGTFPPPQPRSQVVDEE